MTSAEEDQTALVVSGIRLAGAATGANGQMQANLPWAIPVGIVATAAEWLSRRADSLPPPDSAVLRPDIRTVRFDLHSVFCAAAAVLGSCPRGEQRHVLADAAMSLFGAWLVEAEKVVPARPGESAHHLVRRWLVDRPLWAVTRELSAAAGAQRLRRLADELGPEGLGASLRAEIAVGTRLSGAALALRDCGRATGSTTDGTR